MKKLIYFASALLLILSSCAKEAAQKNVPSEGISSLTVSLPDCSKATLEEPVSGARKTVWNAGDQICVNGGLSDPLPAEYEGKTTATFTFDGYIITMPCKVCYPAECWVDESHINLPAVYTGDAQGADKAIDVPLVGYAESSLANLALKQVCSFIKIQLTGTETLKYVEFRGNAGEQVSGEFAFDYTSAEPALNPKDTPELADKVVRTASSAALASEAKYCLIPIPAGIYASGLNVRVVTSEDKYFIQNTDKSREFTRAVAKSLPEFPVTSTGKYWEIENATDWNTFATNYTANSVDLVEIANDIDFDGAAPATVTSFSGTLDGQGYTLSGIASAEPLFTTPLSATIEDLILDGAFSFTVSGSDKTYAAPLAGYANKCNISNITNKATVSVDGTAEAEMYVGGIVAQNHDGTLNSCENDGAITVPNTFSSTADVFIGGIYGCQSGTNSIVNNALNKGDITCKATANTFYVGGIFGSAANGLMSTTVNRNQCVLTSEGATNLFLGGLYGTLQKATAIHHPNATPFSEAGKKIVVKNITPGGTVAVGGLIGRTYSAFNFDGAGLTTMSKAVTIYADDKNFASGTIAVGGFIGLAREALTAGGAGGLKCTGTLSIQLSASYKFYPTCGIGGIVGIAQKGVTISNCSCLMTGDNYVGTNVNSAKQNSTNKIGVGGITGLAYGGASSISGCSVEAKKVTVTIYNNSALSANGGPGVGGIIGEFGIGDNAYAINISNCSVSNTQVWTYRGHGGGIAGYISANSTINSCLLNNVLVNRNGSAEVVAAVVPAVGDGASVTNCGISGKYGVNGSETVITGTDTEACPTSGVASGTYLLTGSL